MASRRRRHRGDRAGRAASPRTITVHGDHVAVGAGSRRRRRPQPVGAVGFVDGARRQVDDAGRMPRIPRRVPHRALGFDVARHGPVRGLRHRLHRDEPRPRLRRQGHPGPGGVPRDRRLRLGSVRHGSRGRRRRDEHDASERAVPRRDRHRRVDLHGVQRADRVSRAARAGAVVGVRDVGVQPAGVPRAQQRGGAHRGIARDQDPPRRCHRLRYRPVLQSELLLLLPGVPGRGHRAGVVDRSQPLGPSVQGVA